MLCGVEKYYGVSGQTSKMALLGAVWAGGGSHRDIRGTHVVDDILGNIGTGGGALKAPIEATRPGRQRYFAKLQT